MKIIQECKIEQLKQFETAIHELEIKHSENGLAF